MTEHDTALQNTPLLLGLDLNEVSNLALSVLHRINFDRFLSDHPGIAATIVQYIARRLSLRLRRISNLLTASLKLITTHA